MTSAGKPDKWASSGTHAANAADQARDDDDAGQLGLLPAQSVEERDGLMPLPSAAKLKVPPAGVGRPLGARNRRTDLMAQYLVERYGDPLEADVAFGTMPLVNAIRELRIVASDAGMKLDLTVHDLLRLQGECRNRALPYIHAKRAPENAQGDPVLPILGIGTFNQQNNYAAGVSLEDAIDAQKTIENKGENDGEAKKSDSQKSDDDANG